ncbi:N-formylglutamate amidohydrolase [Leucobacter chromiiresistens]|uniref:N-formylglutamate amidohydrolase n=1 Tax=Leucobacter chromiiresistens TaxID=1079994 RepID=A0A1H0YRH4_9MICO|nr:N-formylglutamate amidohydrolase [Leucobacter chromiiresistens]SDQ17730.1 N-formylglutamate amidohydrolase [Leucobacter chromiiresistens]
MSAHDLDLIPAGTVFAPSEVIHYADRDMRDLAEAISDADVLVTVPHAEAAIPEELAGFLAPGLTRRLQRDFSDATAARVMRRWAQIDPRVVAVVNPHPRLVRDPNRARPDDLRDQLRQAFDRVRAAEGAGAADLDGVDAIRPVSYSNIAMLDAPATPERLDELVGALTSVASQGLDVYEAMREELTELFITKGLAHGGAFTRLSFHDTMHLGMRPDGSLEPEAPAGGPPRVVTLSNGGDAEGEQRTADQPVTMPPADLRMLADAHRAEFELVDHDAVALNRPYRGEHEIFAAAARFRGIAGDAEAAGFSPAAAQVEFSRAYLLGPHAIGALRDPGTDWVDEDPERIDFFAYACKRAWDAFRDRD